MVFLSVYFLLGTLVSALALLWIIAWYNPLGRTEKQLALSLAHFERIHQDALQVVEGQEGEGQNESHLFYMSPFASGCEKLRSIPDANLVLLGHGAILTRKELLDHIDRWNRHAGSVATPESLQLTLGSMLGPANHLKDLISREYFEEAQKEIHKDILVQAVAPAREGKEWIH